jgi:hypothetical protein
MKIKRNCKRKSNENQKRKSKETAQENQMKIKRNCKRKIKRKRKIPLVPVGGNNRYERLKEKSKARKNSENTFRTGCCYEPVLKVFSTGS